VPHPWHIVFLVLNVVLPGWGTILSAFCGDDLKVWCIMVGLVHLLVDYRMAVEHLVGMAHIQKIRLISS
jgi:hypothetical protein